MITIRSKAATASIYGVADCKLISAKRMDEALIKLKSKGIITGKERMAIKAKLLLERDAIAATMVKTDAKPIAPKTRRTTKEK
jgi:hypothetical protein